MLEADRTDTASLNAELRTARQELEKIEREKKAALSQRPQYYSPQPAVAPAYSTPYRGYTYSYGQGYSTQYTYSPYVPPGTSPPAYPAPTYSTTPSTTSHSSAYTPTTSSMTLPASSATTPNPPSTSSVAAPIPGPTTQQSVVAPIPVQLPSSSLAALSALGIIPVPAANAPPAGQPQPAAVLKGTTQNGATICLEINVSSLQANQMNGLAIILSALTSRGVNVDGAASANSRGVPSGSSGSVRASGKETPSANVGVSSSSGG